MSCECDVALEQNCSHLLLLVSLLFVVVINPYSMQFRFKIFVLNTIVNIYYVGHTTMVNTKRFSEFELKNLLAFPSLKAGTLLQPSMASPLEVAIQ